MPPKLTVGASRRLADPNHDCRGASVSLEIELDAAVVDDPPRLQERIRHLLGLVRASLREELGGDGPVGGRTAGAPQPAANGATPPSPPADTPRRSTASQCKALYAIARAQGINLTDYLRERFRLERAQDLTLRQASAAIDHLRGAAATPRS